MDLCDIIADALKGAVDGVNKYVHQHPEVCDSIPFGALIKPKGVDVDALHDGAEAGR